MFEYLLMPFDTHYDFGFGVTADAYKDAADKLSEERVGLNAHLPVRFLLRHSIELYLKSAIIILHRKYGLPSDAPAGDLMVARVGGEWKNFKVHSIKDLFEYFSSVLESQRAVLSNTTSVDWAAVGDIANHINIIDGDDPDGTMYRYAVTKNPQKDKKKSSSQAASISKIMKNAKAAQKPFKLVLSTDSDDNIIGVYNFDADVGQKIEDALREASDFLYGIHAAMRAEITGGR